MNKMLRNIIFIASYQIRKLSVFFPYLCSAYMNRYVNIIIVSICYREREISVLLIFYKYH